MANENRRMKESAARAGSRAPSNAHILIPRNCKLVTQVANQVTLKQGDTIWGLSSVITRGLTNRRGGWTEM